MCGWGGSTCGRRRQRRCRSSPRAVSIAPYRSQERPSGRGPGDRPLRVQFLSPDLSVRADPGRPGRPSRWADPRLLHAQPTIEPPPDLWPPGAQRHAPPANVTPNDSLAKVRRPYASTVRRIRRKPTSATDPSSIQRRPNGNLLAITTEMTTDMPGESPESCRPVLAGSTGPCLRLIDITDVYIRDYLFVYQ